MAARFNEGEIMSLQLAAAAPRTRYFDLAELHELLEHLGTDATRTLFDTFAGELPRYRTALEAATAQRDFVTLARIVHTLRGTALSFSCTGLAPLCESLKAQCESRDLETCRRSAAALAFAYVCALAELQSLRAPGGLLAA
jgi:HPt (histidine-containing phosphotransfer) domain-containing protein